MLIKFCYNATLTSGGIVELVQIEKKGLYKAQTYLEKHGIDISMTTISRTTQPKECEIPNEEKYIHQLQQQFGIAIKSVTLEFYRA